MKFIQLIVVIILFSCNSKQETEKGIDKGESINGANNKTSSINDQKLDVSDTDIIETFIDSLNIGEKGRCKIELIKHRVYQDFYVIIKFYKKARSTIKDTETWMIQNNYSYETTTLSGFVPNISDFNNDNFNDLTFISGIAARGANEVRRLFIYDDQNKKLISIINSQDYPNMIYNTELDCVEAFLVYGGCSTVFLNIKGDSLKKFANVELSNGLTVSTFDKNGKEKIILKDKSYEGSFIRFKNFRPLKEYDNY